ncbi:hypothetical protein L7H23_01030 [Sphingopyxis sp. BSN-002]|uniref:hypothetical protein n=1 Tax=Sphingopyxis sp. BSN-002 TaxID=2911495 RepID=UPI001EDC7EA9|nr:hypothetical protein [Sphingopyxis sp. BSN-002]UKK84716.1 hypothetical protein L7H23_01030 [Sphingopyxis sp. BSN-002]
MRLIAKHEWFGGEIWWHSFPVGESPSQVFVACSDLFLWGCADLEPLTPDNIALLDEAAGELTAIDDCYGPEWAPRLFCCRTRKMRPQGAYYKYIPDQFRDKFDACGPERQPTFGDPQSAAQAIEARQGGNGKAGAVHESAVPEGNAP